MILLAIIALCVPVTPLSAQTTATLGMRPHCEIEPQSACPTFITTDPSTLSTQTFQPGDVLDMDIVLLNPGAQSIQRVRSWLSYDPDILEGLEITAGKDFSLPIPGETSFDNANGIVKVGVIRQEGVASGALLIVARVRFQVKAAAVSTPVSFYDQQTDTTGHTYALEGGSSQSILSTPLPSLLVQGTAGSGVSATQASSETSSAASSLSSVASSPAPMAFSVLQVQNIRVTTRDSTLYIAWESLPANNVQGYNVYYGTQIGRYIQRRSVSNAATTATIENLPPGVTYYVAVRAVNAQGEESAFSNEAAVQIGNAATSTSPLTSIPSGTTAPGNPVKNGSTVPGKSGPSSFIALLLLCSAAMGTLFAFRRQFAAEAASQGTHHD